MSFKVIMCNGAATINAKFDIIENITKANGLDYEYVYCETAEEIIEKCQDADAVIVTQNRFTAEIIEKLPKLKCIIRSGVGVDVVDIDAASKNGIAVCNQPDYCIDEVASHAFALMMDCIRQITFYNNKMKEGCWRVRNTYKTRRLRNMTLGIISYGNMGRQLTRYARAFDMNVVAYDPFVPAGVMLSAGVRKVELNKLYAVSDVISLHSPLIPETADMINKDSIAKMKDSVIIINVSRGGLIKTADLVDAVRSQKVAAAGIDVFADEPVKDASHPFLTTENIICTPHMAFDSVEAGQVLHESCAVTAVTVSKGLVPYNTINKHAVKQLKK